MSWNWVKEKQLFWIKLDIISRKRNQNSCAGQRRQVANFFSPLTPRRRTCEHLILKTTLTRLRRAQTRRSSPASIGANFQFRSTLDAALFSVLFVQKYGEAPEISSSRSQKRPSDRNVASARHIKRVSVNNGPFPTPLMIQWQVEFSSFKRRCLLRKGNWILLAACSQPSAFEARPCVAAWLLLCYM